MCGTAARRARSSRRRSSRWLCDAGRLRRGSLRPLHLGWRDGQPHGPDRRPRHGAGPAPRPRAAASWCRPRRGARLRLRPGPLLVPAQPRHTLGLPAETLVSVPSDERFRLQADAGGRAPSPRDRAAGLMPLAIVATAGTTNTGSVDDLEDLADLARRRRPVVPRRCRLRRCRAPVRARWPAGSPASSAPTRSPSTRTSGSSRPTTSAACWCATARCWRPPSRIEPEYYRGGGDAARRTRRPRLRRARLLPARPGGHASLPRAQAVALVEAPRDARPGPAGGEERSTWPRRSRRKSRLAPDFEACPEEPELSVVCFRHLPGGARWHRPGRSRRGRRPPGRAAGGAGAERSWLPDHDPSARPHLAARRHPQLHGHAGRPRRAPRRPASPGDAGRHGQPGVPP